MRAVASGRTEPEKPPVPQIQNIRPCWHAKKVDLTAARLAAWPVGGGYWLVSCFTAWWFLGASGNADASRHLVTTFTSRRSGWEAPETGGAEMVLAADLTS